MTSAGIESASFELDLMVEFVCGKHRLLLDTLTTKQEQCLQLMIDRRCTREPLQYILGSWDFLQLRLAVGPGVLVPRPETEELCLLAAKFLNQSENPTALDLCSGSGALALGLQSLCKNAHITAVELMEDAFSYLCQNCKAYLDIFPRIPTPILADVHRYHQDLASSSFSLIVSNPPYLKIAEYAQLEKELYYEPKQALLANEDGLVFYHSIAKNYKRILKPHGALFFEIGATQAKDVQTILLQNGYHNIQLHHDLYGLARIVQAQR